MIRFRLFLLLALFCSHAVIPACAQHWLIQSDPNNWHYMLASVADSQGNVYLCGEGPGNFFVGSIGLIVKRDAQGNLLWQTSAYPSSTDVPHYSQMVVDSQDNLIVAGYTSHTLPISCLTQKFNPQGELLWSKLYSGIFLPGDWRNSAVALKLDAQDNIYLTGMLEYNPAVPGNRAFLLKYDPQGALIREQSYAAPLDSPFSGLPALDVDSQGNCYLLVPLGQGVDQARLVKFGKQGTLLWDRSTTIGETFPYVFAADRQGRVLVGGTFTPPGNGSPTRWQVITYGVDGSELWRDASSENGIEEPKAIKFDRLNNPVVVIANGNLPFESLLIKYTPQGVKVWEQIYPPRDALRVDRFFYINSIQFDSANNLYGVGFNNNRSGVVVKFTAEGRFDWSFRHLSNPNSTAWASLIVDKQDNPFLAVNVYGNRGFDVYRLMKLNTQTRRIAVRTLDHNAINDNRVNYTLVNQQTREVVEEGQQLAVLGTLSLENVPPGRYLLSFAPVGFLRAVYAVDTMEQEFVSSSPTFFPGDITGDNVVDIDDLAAIMRTYNRRSDQLRFDPAADFNFDGVVDIFDLRNLLSNYNRRGESF